MAEKTEFEKDMENLQWLEAQGKVEKGENLEKIAKKLPQWQRSLNSKTDTTKTYEAKVSLADYGRDKDLDILVSDPDNIVRKHVAKRGRDKDLDKLVSDKSDLVRMSVAAQGRDKDLDKLVNDPYYHVRSAVAWQGRDKDLDQLVNDPDFVVRMQVAWQGRPQDLDKLEGDEVTDIREVAEYQKDLKNLKLLQETGKIREDENIEEIASRLLPYWRNHADNSTFCKEKLAMYGRDKDLDKLAHDKDPWVRQTAAKKIREKDLANLKDLRQQGKIGSYEDLNDLADQLPAWRESDKAEDKAKLAKYGRKYDLDKLAEDKHVLERRREAARRGLER